MADTWLDILSDVLLELGAYGPADPIPSEDINAVARICDRVIDGWAALKRYSYNVNFTLSTLTPNHQPHLIGPGLTAPDFAAAVRPVRIEGAALVLTNSPSPVDLPIQIRDDDWWQNQRVKSLTGTVPTSLYYSPDVPNGSIYLWPVPTVAYGLRLKAWVSIGAIPVDAYGNRDLTQRFVAPPAARDALLLTTVERSARTFGKTVTADMKMDASRARAAYQSNNIRSPRMGSADIGTGSGKSGGFNWASGGQD